MDRRDLLKYLLGTGVGSMLAGPTKLFGQSKKAVLQPVYSGWLDDRQARIQFIQKYRYPFLSQLDNSIRGTGAGKRAFLWKFYEKAIGHSIVPHLQAAPDCVSHGFSHAIDVLTCVRILMQNRPEQWIADAASEIIYAGARVEVHGGMRGGGAMGVWAAEWIQRWGVLLRQTYLDFDFTEYSGQVAKKLGKYGVPDELEPLCKLHPVKTCTLVRSYEECRDAVANGYPVIMCSNIGFGDVRDNEGFLSRGRRPWNHAMAITGIDDEYRRPGALVQNSWGPNLPTGPTRHDQPDGSFWCDAENIDAGVRQGDSIAISDYIGYPRHNVPDYILW